jgi:NADH dehydrogenase
MEQGARRKRVVVIGGGFAGAYCSQALERELRPEEAEIIQIDRQNYFIFYPLLIEAGSGGVEPRHAVVSIRSFLKRATFRMLEVTGLDTQRREVICRVPGLGEEERIGYDQLVIALGSVTRLPGVPGLKEHGFQVKGIPDAVGLRDRAIQMLELAESTRDPARRARLLHFVVVGGNFTGVEFAGEMDAVFRSAISEYEGLKRPDVRITLIDRGSRVLSALDEDLSERAARNLRKRGLDIRLHESVTRIEPDRAVLSSGEVIGTCTVVWAAGIAPPPVVAKLGLPLDEHGYIRCDPDLRVTGFADVWGIGDCAVNPDPRGHPYPATAQHAVREGAAAARNIARVMRGEPTRPCVIRSQGSLAALGCRYGVANVMGVKVAGFWAWWLWRTVYLFKMPGLGRKFRVALDWTLELLFGRDYVQLGVHRVGRGADVELEEEAVAVRPRPAVDEVGEPAAPVAPFAPGLARDGAAGRRVR